jgi:RNA 2',3'-cyclic 3'-phosphodiesterase
MRLFVGVEIDESTRSAVAAVIGRLQRRLKSSDIKWVNPVNLHVTVQFIGHVDEPTAAHVRRALERPLSVRPFTMRITGLGVFPGRGGPRVVWCGIPDGARLVSIHHEVAARLAEAARIEDEARPYQPHLTLARYRVPGRIPDRRAIEDERVGEIGRCRVTAVTLYESRLSPRGPTYVALDRTPLLESDSTPIDPVV